MTSMKTVITATLVALAAMVVTVDAANAAGKGPNAGGNPNNPNNPGNPNNPNDPGRPGSGRPNNHGLIVACAPDSNCDRTSVCFYTLPNFRGKSFCDKSGTEMKRLSSTWNDRISSIKVYGALTKICSDDNLEGQCILIGSPRSHLNSLDDAVSSIAIR